MKVKIQVSMVGIGFVWRPGDEVHIDDALEASRLIEAGFAVPVVEQPETAVPDAAEKRGRRK